MGTRDSIYLRRKVVNNNCTTKPHLLAYPPCTHTKFSTSRGVTCVHTAAPARHLVQCTRVLYRLNLQLCVHTAVVGISNIIVLFYTVVHYYSFDSYTKFSTCVRRVSLNVVYYRA
jgi:hypothetical protein